MPVDFADIYAQAQAQSAQNAPSATSSSTDPPLYWGAPSTSLGGHPTQRQVQTKLASEALAEFYTWSDEERDQWGKRLYSAGYTKNPDDFDAQLAGWKYAVANASDYWVNANKKMTPWSFMDMKTKQYQGSAEAGPQTRTSNSTQVNLPSKSDAEATIRAMFKDQLGRDPEDGEMDRYRSMMLAQFRKNPATTTTTTTIDTSGNQTSNSTSKGGFNPQGWLEDEVQGDKEWGAYQAATTYFNALQSALGAAADVG